MILGKDQLAMQCLNSDDEYGEGGEISVFSNAVEEQMIWYCCWRIKVRPVSLCCVGKTRFSQHLMIKGKPSAGSKSIMRARGVKGIN
jgi:hypothetical protein